MDAVLWGASVLFAVLSAALGAVVASLRARLVAARLETERLRAMVKEKVERPNVFSHEIRTPLALIKGAAELLAEETPGPLTGRQREFVSTIMVNAQQVIGLAQDLLTEARIDAQLFELRLERVDLRQLARGVVRDARRVHANQIVLDSSGPPLVLTADGGLLSQAMWNIVNNACRHAGDGASVTLSVSVGEGNAIVAVTDDGGGMSRDERDALFVPFAGSAAGTGLGMMITERIIAEHRGQLLVDTVPGRGTTIFFTLPLEQVEEGL